MEQEVTQSIPANEAALPDPMAITQPESQVQEPQEDVYTEADMAAYLYDVHKDPEAFADPQWVEQAYSTVFKAGEGKWTPEALELFSNSYDQYKKAAKEKAGVSFLSGYEPPVVEGEEDKETRVEGVEKWRTDLTEKVKTDHPDWYAMNKVEADQYIDFYAQESKRKITGEDRGFMMDRLARAGEAGATYVADLFGADDATKEAIGDFFIDNPEFDDSFGTEESQAIGQGLFQIGVPLAAGAAALAFGAPAAIAGAAYVGISGVLSLVGGYKEGYDEVYEATGNEFLAEEAAIRTSLSYGAAENMLDLLVTKGIFSPMTKGLSAANKSRLVAGFMGASRTGTYSMLSEAMTGAVQEAAKQELTQEYTGEDADLGEIGHAGYLEGIAGGAVGGAVGGVQAATASRRSEIQERIEQGLQDPVAPGQVTDSKAPNSTEGLPPQDVFTSEKPDIETTATKVPSKKKLKKKAKPLPVDQQIDIGMQLEKFSQSNEAMYMLKDTHVSNLDEAVLNTLSLKVFQSGNDVLVRKVIPGESLLQDQIESALITATTTPVLPEKAKVTQTVVAETPAAPKVPSVEEAATKIEKLSEEVKDPFADIVEESRSEITDPGVKDSKKTKTKATAKPKAKPITDAARKAKIKETEKKIRDITPKPDLRKSKIEHTTVVENPKEIGALKEKSKNIPDAARLKKEIALLTEKATKRSKVIEKQRATSDPAKIKIVEQMRDKLLGEVSNKKKLLRAEAESGTLTKHKAEIDREVSRKSSEWEASKKGYTKTKSIKVSQSRALSKATNTEYSGSLNPNLRAFMNSTIAGFNLRGETLNQIYVVTANDIVNKALENASPAAQLIAADLQKTVLAEKQTNGFAAVVDGTGVIVLRDGAFSRENVYTAAHEIGHLVLEANILNNKNPELMDKVFEEYQSFRSKAFEHEYAADALRAMGLPSYMIDSDKKITDLTKDEREYYFGDKLGFEEFLANQIAYFATNPDLIAKTAPQKLYKRIADAFYKIWKGILDLFPQQAPTFQEWLTSNFDTDKAKSIFNKNYKQRTDVKKGPGQRTQKLSERISKLTDSKRVRAATKKQIYTPLSSKMTLAQIKAQIKPEFIESHISEVLDTNNDIDDNVRGSYAVAVLEALESMVAAEKDVDAKRYLEDVYSSFTNDVASKATTAGRFIQSFALLNKMTKRGREAHVVKEVERAFAKAKRELPPNYREIIKELVNKYHSQFTATDSKFITQVIDQMLHKELRDRVGLPFSGSLLDFVWYGNFLSGIDTQAVNFGISAIDLAVRTTFNAVRNPSDIPIIIRGLGPAVSRGFTAAKASLRGMDIRAARADKFGIINSTITPYTSWENKHIKNAADAGLKALDFFPFRFLRAADMFMANVASELKTFRDVANAIRATQKAHGTTLSAPEFSRFLDTIMGIDANSINAARTRATQEINSVYQGAEVEPGRKATMIELRAMEIIDNKRDPGLVAAADRAGSLATYNMKPEGTFGAVADGMNVITKKWPLVRYTVLPFVNVVANVLSQNLDYSPIGLLRALKGNHLFNKNDTQFSYDERMERGTVGVLSTLGMGALMYSFAKALEEAEEKGERPSVEWTAMGPRNPSQRSDWISKGNVPYSIRIGDTILKYSEFPGAQMFAAIGAIFDEQRYNKKWSQADATTKLATITGLSIAGITEMGFLKSISNIADLMTGKGNITAPVGTALTGFRPYAGLQRNIANYFQPEKVDYKDAKAHLLAGVPYFKSYVNTQLNAFGEPLDRVGRFYDKMSPDPVFKWLANNNLVVPGITGTAIGSSNDKWSKYWFNSVKAKRLAESGDIYYSQNFTEEQIRDIHLESGPKIKERISVLMQPRYADMDNKAKQAYIKKVVGEERRIAKIKILKRDLGIE